MRKTFVELDDELLRRLGESSFLAGEIGGGGSRIFILLLHGKANLVGGRSVEAVFGFLHRRPSRAFGWKRHEISGEKKEKKKEDTCPHCSLTLRSFILLYHIK